MKNSGRYAVRAMCHSRAGEVEKDVIAALEGGASVTQAATSVGMAEETLRSWICRGRQLPDGQFAAFAAAFEHRAYRAVVAPADPYAPPARDELLRRLDQPSLAGSTRATELLLRELPAHQLADDGQAARRLLSLVP